MLEEKDYLELLRLLQRYDSLLDQLQKSMGEGFSQLSRANYYNKDSLRGRYGSDYWDEYYEGHLRIAISDKGLVLTKEEKNGEPSLEKQSKEDGKSLRRRYNGEEKFKEHVKSEKKRDPIMMFGGALSIPSALRKSQFHFKASIPLMVELINCSRSIQSITTRKSNGGN